jgi:hypothetical protein
MPSSTGSIRKIASFPFRSDMSYRLIGLADTVIILSIITACIFIATVYPYTVVTLTEHSKRLRAFWAYLTLSSAIALFLEVLILFLLYLIPIKSESSNPSSTLKK